MRLDPLPQPRVRTAHDVRHLVACHHCEEVGDDRQMVNVFPGKSHYHGRCYISRFGLKSFVDLPKVQTNKVTLGDIGAKAARALLDHWDECGG